MIPGQFVARVVATHGGVCFSTFMATTVAPIVLTLELDSKSQLFFDALRQQHFPKGRSFLAVHLVLFHHLPGGNYDAIRAQMATAAAAEAPLPIVVTGVRFLGHGVAYSLENQCLRALHKWLQKQWHGELIPQDQQKLNPACAAIASPRLPCSSEPEPPRRTSSSSTHSPG
jgi:hypothetical protein